MKSKNLMLNHFQALLHFSINCLSKMKLTSKHWLKTKRRAFFSPINLKANEFKNNIELVKPQNHKKHFLWKYNAKVLWHFRIPRFIFLLCKKVAHILHTPQIRHIVTLHKFPNSPWYADRLKSDRIMPKIN